MKQLLCTVFMSLTLQLFGQHSNFPTTLSMPFDEDTIETQTPTFIWQCNLSAIQNDPRLTLQFLLVEIEDNQSKSEAIAVNTPIFSQHGIEASSLAYTNTMYELEKGKSYVWQVKVLFNDQPIQESAPYKFTIYKPIPIKPNYILLRRQVDGSHYRITTPAMYLMIKNENQVMRKQAIIRDKNNQIYSVELEDVADETNENTTTESNHSEGNYYVKVALEPMKLPTGNYTFEWRSQRGDVYTLNFELP